MNIYEAERLLDYARDNLPSDVRHIEGMYEVFDAAKHSFWKMAKEENVLNNAYHEGKRFCKNAIQAAVFVSPIISVAIYLILYLINDIAEPFFLGIILQSVIMYIVYRIIDIYDKSHHVVDDDFPGEKEII